MSPLTPHQKLRDEGLEDQILRSLRRITRSIALHSRKLATTFGLTGPQLVCLRVIEQRGETTPSEIAREVSLSYGTITGIIDRLAARQLVRRERTSRDRRVVTVALTEAGEALVSEAPSPLQERFLQRLSDLPEGEQTRVRDTLAQVVQMMDGEGLEVSPILDLLQGSLEPIE